MADLASDGRSPIDELGTVVRWVLILAGSAAVVPVVVTLVLRQFDIALPLVVGYVAATPLITFSGLFSVLVLLAARWWPGAAVAGALTVILVLTQVPMYLGSTGPDGPATEVTVMTVNLHHGGGDPDGVVRLVRDLDVDVLALEELTPEARLGMAAAGLDDLLPNSVATPESDSGDPGGSGGNGGNGIWSRYPLDALPAPKGFRRPPVAAEMDVDGQTVFVAAVHPTSPYPANTTEWSDELGRLAGWLGPVDGPAIVAGDFNATYDHRQFPRRAGHRPARRRRAGRGRVPAHLPRRPAADPTAHHDRPRPRRWRHRGHRSPAGRGQRHRPRRAGRGARGACPLRRSGRAARQRGRTVVVTATIEGRRGVELKPKRTGGSTSVSGPRSTPSHEACTAVT